MSKLIFHFSRISSKLHYLTLSFILIYTIAALTVSLFRYWQSQVFYFDFGIFDTAIWKVSRFELPIIDHVIFGPEKIIIFATHFSPSIFLFSPLYWFTDRSEILLIAQTLSVSVAAIFAYLIAKKITKNNLVVLSLIVAFLGYFGLQNALISEFHDATVVVLPLTVLFWAIVNSKWKIYFLMLIIILGFKESFAGFGVALGIYVILKDKKNYKQAISTILISLIWGIVALKFIIPYFSGGMVNLYLTSHPPKDLFGLAQNFLFPDSKWQTIVYSFLTFGFLPLFDLAILPAIFENFFERFILSDEGSRWDLGLHYNAPLSPLLFMGALATFSFLERKFGNKLTNFLALGVILIVIYLHYFVLHGPLGLFYNPAFYTQTQGVEYLNNFAKYFPKTGIIMTQNDIGARLSHQDVRIIRLDYKSVNPDYVILNLTPGQNPNSFYPWSLEQVTELKNKLLEDQNYKVTKYADELYLFSKE